MVLCLKSNIDWFEFSDTSSVSRKWFVSRSKRGKKQTEFISDDYLQDDYSNSFQQGLHFFLFFVFKRSNFGELLNM